MAENKRKPGFKNIASDEDEKELYKIAIDARNFEIEQVWKRANVFWLFTAGAFLAFYAAKSEGIYSVMIANVGFFCTACWAMVNRGSKYWQHNFESRLSSIEWKNKWLIKVIEPYDFKEKRMFSGGLDLEESRWVKRYSPTKLLIACSDFLTLVWFLLLIYSNCRLLIPCFIKMLSWSIQPSDSILILHYCINLLSDFFFSFFSIVTVILVLVLFFNKAKGED